MRRSSLSKLVWLGGGLCAAFAMASDAATRPLYSTLDAAQSVPASSSSAGAVAIASYDDVTKQISLSIEVTGINPMALIGAHIHLGATGATGTILLNLGTANWIATASGMRLATTLPFPAANEADLLNGNTYFNLHTTSYASGEIRGQIGGFRLEIMRSPSRTAGSASPFAHAINRTGQAAGAANFKSGSHAALWQANGTVVDLGGLGGTYSTADDINDAGQVAGSAQTRQGAWHPFFWSNGVMQDLGTLSGTGNAYATAIGKNGHVVGYSDTASGHSHAFLWDGKTLRDLGTLPGGYSSFAQDINDNGEIVGIADGRAVRWSASGVITDIGTVPAGSSGAGAYGVNNPGLVTGTWHEPSGGEGGGFDHAAIWLPGSIGAIDLGLGRGSDAQDANDAGLVIGSAHALTGAPNKYAYLWSNGVLTNLAAAFGGYASDGRGVNGSGQVVGQVGYDSSGARTLAFRLTPSTQPASADVALSVASVPTSVAVGATVRYALTLKNNGPDTANLIAVKSVLPAAVAVTVNSSEGECSVSGGTATTVVCLLPALGNGETGSVTIDARATVGGELTNAMSVSAVETDTNTANNTLTTSTSVTQATSDLSISATDAPDPIARRKPLTYTATVTNRGPSAAADVIVSDSLPSSMKFVSATASQGSCKASTNVQGTIVGCQLGQLAANAIATVKIVVKPQQAGVITNVIQTQDRTGADPDYSNNYSIVTTTVK